MEMSGMGTMRDCRGKSKKCVGDGGALAKFSEMIGAQGGDRGVIDDYSLFGCASITEEIRAVGSGYINGMETADIGVAANMLGAGRSKIGDPVDHTAGIILKAKTGDRISKGDILAVMKTNKKEAIGPAAALFLKSLSVSAAAPEKKPLIYAHVCKDLSVVKYV
jgi:pyrimidine-nucleoside phosphorylase